MTQYIAFTITAGKEKGSFRIWADRKPKDGWEGGETFMELFSVSGVLVAMRNMTRPVAVFKDINHCIDSLEKQYGVKPVMK